MRVQKTPKRHGPPARGAFTMLELLVVLLVIGLLVALTAGTVVRVMDSQKKSTTQVTLNKIQSQLTKQWNAYKDVYWREDAQRLYPNQWNYVLSSLSQNDSKRARVIWVKLRMKQAFPATFSEALSPIVLGSASVTLQPLPGYVTGLGTAGVTASDGGACESAACLLLALQQSPTGGGAKAEDLAGTSIRSFTTNNGKTVQAFADEWGSPLQFSRWPISYARLFPGGVASNGGIPGATNDPGDPEGTLTVATWLRVNGNPSGMMTNERIAFSGLCHGVPDRTVVSQQPLVTTPNSFKLVPVVVSPGPDKNLGLTPPSLAGGGGPENDNLDSLP